MNEKLFHRSQHILGYHECPLATEPAFTTGKLHLTPRIGKLNRQLERVSEISDRETRLSVFNYRYTSSIRLFAFVSDSRDFESTRVRNAELSAWKVFALDIA